MKEREALIIARGQIQIRIVQLASCGACGSQRIDLAQAASEIERMIKERDNAEHTGNEEPS